MSKLSARNLKSVIKRHLKGRSVTYGELADKLGVAEVTVKRWLTHREIKVGTLFKILEALDLRLSVQEIRRRSGKRLSGFSPYSLEQENYFVEHPRDLLLFLKLHFSMNGDRARLWLGISDAEFRAALGRLERIKALKLLPFDKVQFSLKGPFTPAKNGPMVKHLFKKVRDRLLTHFRQSFPPLTDLSESNALSQFRAYEFYATEETARKFSGELREIVARYYYLGTLEAERREEVVPISAVIGVDQFDVWSAVINGDPS